MNIKDLVPFPFKTRAALARFLEIPRQCVYNWKNGIPEHHMDVLRLYVKKRKKEELEKQVLKKTARVEKTNNQEDKYKHLELHELLILNKIQLCHIFKMRAPLGKNISIKDALPKWQMEQLRKMLSNNFREHFLLIPKKNGKSFLLGIFICVYLLINKHKNIVLVSPTRDSSESIFNVVKTFFKLSNLSKEDIKVTAKSVECIENFTKFSVFTSKGESVVGVIADVVIIEETHMFSTTNQQIMLQELTGSHNSTSFKLIQISTMSASPPVGFFRKKLEIARKVFKEPGLDSSFNALIYELDDKKYSYKNPPPIELVLELQPSLGVTQDRELFIKNWKNELIYGDPYSIQAYFAKYANIEPSFSTGANKYGLIFIYDENIYETVYDMFNLTKEQLKDFKAIFYGFDGGGLDDLIGFCVMGVTKENHIHLGVKGYITPVGLEANKTYEHIYTSFIDNGITVVQNLGDEINEIIRVMQDIENIDRIKHKAFGFDRRGGSINELLNCFHNNGFNDLLIEVKQGSWLGPAADFLEAQTAAKKIHVQNREFFRWNVDNAEKIKKGNLHYLANPAHSYKKIDSLIAVLTALSAFATFQQFNGNI